MKLNIADPSTACQKTIEIENEKLTRIFYDKQLGAEVPIDTLGETYKGYIVKVTGGSDKQGFPMMQGVLEKKRVRLLLDGTTGRFKPKRDGHRRRKSVRGCIISPEISVLDVIIVKKGDNEIEGVTDDYKPRRLGPKRANNIRKLFKLTKDDDVRKYVIRREIKKEGHHTTKAPKIQRLVTPQRVQRKRRRKAIKRNRGIRSRAQAAEYAKLMAQRQRERREALISKRREARSSARSSKLAAGTSK
mmetsp:Transcript_18111/g.26954  ORF Transcript_18111/g.26954 Transcript_18111/m.26954 type:complete len:246 (+) Transcript_18111:293-1030(+)|eukprot:CAMPEP_0201548880 /NCGR_PEP_ID=MMETSP0173_2-20130828/5384_1 /ASSEMBLY_ACC=CAM_ASM_000268 /TAXON_ID=218659 /ORGANISM="Vexillifera sp., Strain DIVA3 564/2" /LENGTH=245 /DNA_ID=CAMNT_0047958389 /DNA_START=280 /DNA_END=1017 /DNA_ORIENTATION=+